VAAKNPSLLARTGRGGQGKRLVAALLLLALSLGLAWAWTSYFAAPAPSGEPYRVVSGWPQLTDDIHHGQVSGVSVNSHGQVFVFRRAERAWQGEPLSRQPPSRPPAVIRNPGGTRLFFLSAPSARRTPHRLLPAPEDH
jgi:hypothetical protein